MARSRVNQEIVDEPVEESSKKQRVKKTKIKEGSVPVRIRAGAGIEYAHVEGKYLGKGFFEVDEIVPGTGSKSGWGRLVNGEGWVALDFVEILK